MKTDIRIFRLLLYAFVLIIVGLAIPTANGQSPLIIEAEYFYDTDPGEGNGTNIPFTADSVIDINFNMDVTGLSLGFHKAYVRTKDDNNIWSFTNIMNIYIEDEQAVAQLPLPDLIAAEYYFDVDPGEGNGVNIPITNDSIIDENFNMDLTGLSIGFHKAYVRTKDDNNIWSFTNVMNIFVEDEQALAQLPLPDLIAAEYYFDTDPGEGNGVNIPITNDSIIDENFNMDLMGLSSGFHKAYVRTKDEDNKWCHTNVMNIFVEDEQQVNPPPLPDIVKIEYYIDIDPGFGNGSQVSIPGDSIIHENFGTVVTGLSIGEHKLCFRVKDENGTWSHTNYSSFYIMGLQAFLEGPYNPVSGEMETDLNDNGYLPLQQPFDADPSADWYYTGNENVTSIPNTDIVDWLLLQVRDTTSAANAIESTIIETRAAFLLKDGNIVDLDGITPAAFAQSVNNDFYVVLFHRNHIGILSSVAVPQNGAEAYTYNFSSSQSQVYGDSTAHKEISSGVWGMFAGDGVGDGQIDNKDKNDSWFDHLGETGYKPGDFDMTGVVDNPEKDDIWEPNSAIGSKVPE